MTATPSTAAVMRGAGIETPMAGVTAVNGMHAMIGVVVGVIVVIVGVSVVGMAGGSRIGRVMGVVARSVGIGGILRIVGVVMSGVAVVGIVMGVRGMIVGVGAIGVMTVVAGGMMIGVVVGAIVVIVGVSVVGMTAVMTVAAKRGGAKIAAMKRRAAVAPGYRILCRHRISARRACAICAR